MALNTKVAGKLKDIEAADPNELGSRWLDIDRSVADLPEDEQVSEWIEILRFVENLPTSKGHPYFRLGVLHLLRDTNETKALAFLERAYNEDQVYAPRADRLAHRMGAYRLLALVKGYFEYLAAKAVAGKPNWESEQFQGSHRRNQIETLLVIYDRSLIHPLDLEGHTYQSFFRLMGDKDLCRFAIENYYCGEELIRFVIAEAPASFRNQHDYPLARAIVGLLAGVIEAILADRLPSLHQPTLGQLMREAYAIAIIQKGSRLAALCSLMLYLRNHVHPDRDVQRNSYFVDMNVARGCKAALDWVLTEMLQTPR